LGAERTLLNFLQQLSGVATSTAAYVAETAGTHCQILDTRKTIPGWRTLQKYAVRCGGGTNHRIGLFDMIMLKDNHIAASGGVAPAIQKVLCSRPSSIPIEVEVENLEQLEIVLPYPVEQIMLDNMDLETMKKAVERIRSYPHSAKIEASGNMTLDRIAAVAATGVDYISIGALTHTIAALDLSMRFV
jgi:nicotinate-nucleotide pyrophosphorylase (carboxylating)